MTLKPAILLLVPLALCGCDSKPNPRVETRLNTEATLPATLPYNPLANKVITSAIDHRNATMYTVFGNDTAIAYARTSAGHAYPAGSQLSLVTWNQQEDPRWFGGRIPAAPKSIEFVTINPDGSPTYEAYAGSPLTKIPNLDPIRAHYITTQRAAVMP